MIIQSVLLIVGFALLIAGADWLVKGASSLARRIGVSTLVVGLTIVAFGTSAPELVVNIVSVLKGTPDIAIANVLGSNIANILLIMGVGAMAFPLVLHKGSVWKEIPFSLLAALLLIVLGSDFLFDGGGGRNILSRADGLVLLVLFLAFLYYSFSISKNGTASDTVKTYGWMISVGMVIGGLVGLIVGGKVIVDAAVDVARTIGVSEHLIGLTIVAVGTSLPELATILMAAVRRQTDIAVGTVVGSSIFNIFFILGVSATLAPLPYSMQALQDSWIVVAVSLLLFLSMFVGKRHTLERWQGVLFIAVYIAYLAFLIIRG